MRNKFFINVNNKLGYLFIFALQQEDHPGRARMTSELRSDHPGFACMTWSLCDHHGGKAAMTCGLRPHHPDEAWMISKRSSDHPGEAWMIWSLCDHHGGKATIMVAKRPSWWQNYHDVRVLLGSSRLCLYDMVALRPSSSWDLKQITARARPSNIQFNIFDFPHVVTWRHRYVSF
jgi:hypothetical protein